MERHTVPVLFILIIVTAIIRVIILVFIVILVIVVIFGRKLGRSPSLLKVHRFDLVFAHELHYRTFLKKTRPPRQGRTTPASPSMTGAPHVALSTSYFFLSSTSASIGLFRSSTT